MPGDLTEEEQRFEGPGQQRERLERERDGFQEGHRIEQEWRKGLEARVRELEDALRGLEPFWMRPIPVDLGLALKAWYGEETVKAMVASMDAIRAALAASPRPPDDHDREAGEQ